MQGEKGPPEPIGWGAPAFPVFLDNLNRVWQTIQLCHSAGWPRPGPELVTGQDTAQLRRAHSRGSADTAPNAHQPRVFGLAQPAENAHWLRHRRGQEGTKGPSASRDTGRSDTEGGGHLDGVGRAQPAAPLAAFLKMGLVSHPQGLGSGNRPGLLGDGHPKTKGATREPPGRCGHAEQGPAQAGEVPPIATAPSEGHTPHPHDG